MEQNLFSPCAIVWCSSLCYCMVQLLFHAGAHDSQNCCDDILIRSALKGALGKWYRQSDWACYWPYCLVDGAEFILTLCYYCMVQLLVLLYGAAMLNLTMKGMERRGQALDTGQMLQPAVSHLSICSLAYIKCSADCYVPHCLFNHTWLYTERRRKWGYDQGLEMSIMSGNFWKGSGLWTTLTLMSCLCGWPIEDNYERPRYCFTIRGILWPTLHQELSPKQIVIHLSFLNIWSVLSRHTSLDKSRTVYTIYLVSLSRPVTVLSVLQPQTRHASLSVTVASSDTPCLVLFLIKAQASCVSAFMSQYTLHIHCHACIGVSE